MTFRFIILIIAFSISHLGFSQNLLLFDGETVDVPNCQYHYGAQETQQVHTGSYAFQGTPDPWHSPGISMKCQGAWRKNISTYNTLEFYIKASALGHSASVSFYGWPNSSKGVDILPYIEGGILDTEYKKVSIPLDSLKTTTYKLESIEILYFGKAVNGSGYTIYVDDVWAVDTRPNAVDTVRAVSNTVLKLDIMHRYDTTQVQDTLLYTLSSTTDADFAVPRPTHKVGMHYYVKNFENQVIAIPIFEQELFLVFTKKMKNGHTYTLTVNNIQDLSHNNFISPYVYTFTYNDLDNISGTVKANQVGYQPNGFKYAYIGNYLGGAGYLDLSNLDVPVFEIRNASTDAVVYSGVPTLRGTDVRLSGEKVFDCNFTAFQTPGSYYVYVPNMGRSYDFDINIAVYDSVYWTALRGLYYQRHSQSLTTPFVPAEYVRAGCPTTATIDISHTSSSLYNAASDHPVGTVLDMPGGWFDAGDYGRYIPTASVALDYLFNAYEMYPQKFSDNFLNIPETGNGIPDILDEAKVELDWMLHMQAPDGGVYFKVTTSAYANSIPALNTDTRYIAEKTTFSTALFAATMAQAYRQYQPFLPVFADTCLARAQRAWTFLEAHPDPVPVDGYENQGNLGGGTYSDPLGDADDRAWAAAELYKSTGNTAYHTAFEFYWLQHPANWGWNFFQHHQQKASWAYCTTTNYPINPSYYSTYANLIKTGLDNYDKVRANQNIYRCSYRSDVIPWIGWGSFAQSSSYSWGFIQGYYLWNNPEYLDYARLNFDVQLGNNPQYKTYITGIGHQSPMFPTHHPSYHDGVVAPVPGLPVHGPHSHIPLSNGFYTESQKKANLYPFGEQDYDPYPTLRRYYDIFHLVQMSEFTIEHIAKTAVAFAFFNTNTPSAPLPIELSDFHANCSDGGTHLFWTTLSEKQHHGFEVQRMDNTTDTWESITFIAGAGNSATTTQYRYEDTKASRGNTYYRLKEVANNGTVTYSKAISAHCSQEELHTFTLFPNPAGNVLNITTTDETATMIEIYDVLGRRVLLQEIAPKIDISKLANGHYFVKIGNKTKALAINK